MEVIQYSSSLLKAKPMDVSFGIIALGRNQDTNAMVNENVVMVRVVQAILESHFDSSWGSQSSSHSPERGFSAGVLIGLPSPSYTGRAPSGTSTRSISGFIRFMREITRCIQISVRPVRTVSTMKGVEASPVNFSM